MNALLMATCVACELPFTPREKDADRPYGQYCSRRCFDANYPRRPLAERFWPKVDMNGPVPANRPELGPCYVWTANRNRKGYGRIGLAGKGVALAHRVGYELQVGPIPEGLDPDYLCRNPSCVRGSHLEPVTKSENFLRGEHLNAVLHRLGQCKHGHRMEGDNVYHRRDGYVDCNACKQDRYQRMRPPVSGQSEKRAEVR